MRLLLSWIASSVIVLLMPIYVPYIYDQIRAQGVPKAWKHILLALTLVSGVFFLGWYGLTPSTAASARRTPALELMNKTNVEEELNLRKQTRPTDAQEIDRAMYVIKTKFEEAIYAQQKGDYDRGLRLYEEIDQGSDENGSFYPFHSASILNNMAAVYFQKQGNRGFKASGLLSEALRLEPKPLHERDLIQRNIDALDKYLN